MLVQTGDELDRGDGEQEIVDLFDRLAVEARAAGGVVYALNGNHEVMNVQLDFRYVTEGGFKDSSRTCSGSTRRAPASAPVPPPREPAPPRSPPAVSTRGRLAARDVIIAVGDTVFAHGGVLPAHTRYGIARISREVRAWMEGGGGGGGGGGGEKKKKKKRGRAPPRRP